MSKFLNIYKKSQFNPGFIGLFINPFFFIRRRLYKAIKKNSTRLSGTILDIGCGSMPYKNLFTNCSQYIGMDIENPGHDHSKEKIDIYYDGKTMPFEDGSIDNIFMSEVLEHIDNPQIVLNEIKRILKPNGILLLTTPFVWYEHEIPNDFYRYTRYGLETLLKEFGLNPIKTEQIGSYFETNFQLHTNYFYNLFRTKNKFLNLLFTFLFISPLNIIGLIMIFLFPKNNLLYFGTLVIAKNENINNK